MRMRSTHWRVTQGNKQTASCGYLNANTGLRASNFHLISYRQRHHEKFANILMHPKPFSSRHTRHGIKYEPEAHMNYMNNRSIPVQVFKSGLVVYEREPVLAWSPDGKVIDAGYSKPFGLLEVKCPETKFLVSPLDACSDPSFCSEPILIMHKSRSKWG